MTINNLYISTPDYRWNKPKTILLNKENLDQVLASPQPDDYHTTINDIKTQNLQKICKEALSICLVDIKLSTVTAQDYKGHDQYS